MISYFLKQIQKILFYNDKNVEMVDQVAEKNRSSIW